MQFKKKLIEACKKSSIDKVNFLRLSCYQLAGEDDIERIAQQGLQFLLDIKRATDPQVTIQRIIPQRNAQAVLIAGCFSDGSLFNLSLALLDSKQEALFRVEVVGDLGMVQYDSSSDSAFTIYGYPFNFFSTEEIDEQIKALFKQLAISKERVS
ncbi:hypothetical protein JZO70_01080 [Enterococcus sp. 669A]|uniref:Uncharacterized protein n=1 Tax=Candidatus Enterococcus moelleringii TaxID=2815325 RepID=A0ABS3L556_9ENTE|nr:hypothetical protein [Enterococcus sp. 669A]MBO1304737.1 hypothetical protein [Enterococcus sp. 669A]